MGEMATGIAHELNQPLAAIANESSRGMAVVSGQNQRKIKEQRFISLCGQQNQFEIPVIKLQSSFLVKKHLHWVSLKRCNAIALQIRFFRWDCPFTSTISIKKPK
jgi:hypothetical protein